MNPNTPLPLPAELPIARYRFSFRLQDPLQLPTYAGSTLRGVFGHALRRAACMTRQSECAHCPLLHTCPYSRIFVTPPTLLLNKSQQQNPPQPYIIEAPADGIRHYPAGSRYTFTMVLIGHARQQLPLIAYAWSQAFERGIGAQQARGSLEDIAIEQHTGWHSLYRQGRIESHEHSLTLPKHYPTDVNLHFHTPLRLQQQGRILGIHRLNAEILLSQLLRRTSTLATLYWHSIHADYTALRQAAARVHSRPQLQWQDWRRYSNRQQQEMALGGAIGTWQLWQLPLAYAQLLYIGQWLHIGKETVFGHGRYTLNLVNSCLSLQSANKLETAYPNPSNIKDKPTSTIQKEAPSVGD